MLDKALEGLVGSGLGGAIMGAVFLLVVSPLIKTLIDQVRAGNAHADKAMEEIAAQRLERETTCRDHLHLLDGMKQAVEALVRRANGG